MPGIMWPILQAVLVSAYVASPAVALAWALRAAHRGRPEAVTSLLLTAVAGVLIGAGLVFVYARAIGGSVPAMQWVLAMYLGVSLLLILKAFDAGLLAVTRRLFGVKRRPPAPTEADAPASRLDRPARPARRPAWRLASVSLARVLVLFLVGLPYVMAAVMVYRPKVVPGDIISLPVQHVRFASTDGVELAGWWLPAAADLDNGRTVVMCHGLGAGKFDLADAYIAFASQGYSVLAFDFRAHGESGGQISSFGDAERNDVLAAVRWVRAQRGDNGATPREIVGLGVSMGAAALLGAAADDSDDGRAISAVCVVSTFDDLQSWADDIARQQFFPPLSWSLKVLALPLASAHAGRDLVHFAPAKLIDGVWPRPVMVVHGARDGVIDLSHGQKLYDAAYEPRRALWLPNGPHTTILRDAEVLKAILDFFDTAKPSSVVRGTVPGSDRV